VAVCSIRGRYWREFNADLKASRPRIEKEGGGPRKEEEKGKERKEKLARRHSFPGRVQEQRVRGRRGLLFVV